ncbi:hypothetical protein D9M72_466310 [compost metagenome]
MCIALPSMTRVSMPRPPSRRAKSPLLMRIVSSPAPPCTTSLVPTLMKVSLPAPPSRRSAKPSLAMILSLLLVNGELALTSASAPLPVAAVASGSCAAGLEAGTVSVDHSMLSIPTTPPASIFI